MAFNDTWEQIKNFNASDVDFEKIGVWPVAAKALVMVVVIIVVFSLTYYLQVSDLYASLESAKAKEVSLKKTYEEKSFEAANLDAYRAQMAEMNSTFTSLLSRLPSKTEVPGLLEDIGARARESGLTIKVLTMGDAKAAEYYIEVPIKIVVEGGYHDLGGFVSGVAGLPRIVTLHDYAITKNKGTGVLSMQIDAKTYRYKTQEQEQ
ncbi:MAG TPA: type 4a pilus biogenesis protein PilO [Cellvibrio sp.]|nr:type 4a pilus biogenesis protein PilO [Cellvibrio sp.]